jgi:ABC-type amino acid transport substrate-binding protein
MASWSKACWWMMCCLSACASADTGCGHIKVGGSLWDETASAAVEDSVIGAGHKLLQRIAQLLPVTVEVLPPVPFSRQLSQLTDGELDAALWIYPVEKRRRAYHLTAPYFREPLFLYSRKPQVVRATEIDELSDYIGVVLRHNSYGIELDAFFETQGEKVYMVERQAQAVAMVASGRADYFVASPMTSGVHDAKSPILRGDQPFMYQAVVMAFSKKSACRQWVAAINDIIASGAAAAALKADKTPQ